MAIVLNEVKQAEEIINTGEIGNKPSATLFLLAKYCRKYLNYSSKDTVKYLDKFMSKYYINYNSVLWEDIVENISKSANKYPIREISEIGITQSELNNIKLLNNIKYEKLIFTLLCYTKLHNLVNENNNNWSNCKIPELFKISRVNVKYKNDKMFMLNDIKNKLLFDTIDNKGNNIKIPLISFSKKNDNKNIKLNFIDTSNKYVLLISDFRELGYEYLLYKGGDYSRCETCNVLFKQNKNNTYKFCNKHRGYQPIGTKTITCIDCGEEVVVDAKDNKTERCNECYEIHRRNKVKENVRRYRERNKNKDM